MSYTFLRLNPASDSPKMTPGVVTGVGLNIAKGEVSVKSL